MRTDLVSTLTGSDALVECILIGAFVINCEISYGISSEGNVMYGL